MRCLILAALALALGGCAAGSASSAMPDDLQDFAERYTAAWCSQEPARVASFYAEGGVLVVGGGPKGACAFRWSAAATMSLASVTVAGPARPAEVASQAARRVKQPGPKRQPWSTTTRPPPC